MLHTYEQRSKAKLAATVVTIVIIAGLVVLTDHLQSAKTAATDTAQQTTTDTTASPASDSTDTTNTTDTPTSDTSSAATSIDASSGYKDGTYSASSSYTVPPGQESIQVSLTISGGVITSASVKNSENDFDSAQYQEEFSTDYKAGVVGKKISGLKLGIIAGASETTGGFNAAVAKIASEAQA